MRKCFGFFLRKNNLLPVDKSLFIFSKSLHNYATDPLKIAKEILL